MPNLEFESVLPSISESDLTLIEGWLGLALPQSYRQFILKYNGGYPNKTYFGKPEESIFNIQTFFGFSLLSDEQIQNSHPQMKASTNILEITREIHPSETPSTLARYEDYYVLLRNRGKFPKHLLCIGSNASSDYYFISTSENDFGYIYEYFSDELDFWDENDNFIEECFFDPLTDFSDIYTYNYEDDISLEGFVEP